MCLFILKGTSAYSRVCLRIFTHVRKDELSHVCVKVIVLRDLLAPHCWRTKRSEFIMFTVGTNVALKLVFPNSDLGMLKYRGTSLLFTPVPVVKIKL